MAPAHPAPAVTPQHFSQDDGIAARPGLVTADVGEIAWSGKYLWVATASGLARLDPLQRDGRSEEDWITFDSSHGLSRGGISAIAASGDTVWIATVSDTVVAGLANVVGQGLSFSTDGGARWEVVANAAIFDTTVSGFERGPTTTIQNPCWGLALDGDTVIGTFLAGAAVRSPDHGRSWARMLPDGAAEIVYFRRETGADSLTSRADSLESVSGITDEVVSLRATADSLAAQELMHRTFSALAFGDTILIGTANGIGRSLDGGLTWTNIRVRHDDGGALIPGNPGANWVVALERQRLPDGGSVIWAGTRSSGRQADEVNSISFSADYGDSWTVAGPTFAWDFAFTDNRIWAGTNQGLMASSDGGRTWEDVLVSDDSIRDQLQGAVTGLDTVDGTLWVGAENGLGVSTDEGATWHIVTGLAKVRTVDTGRFLDGGGENVRSYAAPNPFAPSRDRTRIVYSLERDAEVTIEIFDFASRLVTTLIEDESRGGGQRHAETWDGAAAGKAVSNGVYLYRLSLDGGEETFGKVVVLD